MEFRSAVRLLQGHRARRTFDADGLPARGDGCDWRLELLAGIVGWAENLDRDGRACVAERAATAAAAVTRRLGGRLGRCRQVRQVLCLAGFLPGNGAIRRGYAAGRPVSNDGNATGAGRMVGIVSRRRCASRQHEKPRQKGSEKQFQLDAHCSGRIWPCLQLRN